MKNANCKLQIADQRPGYFQRMLAGQGGDPNIVLGDWPASQFDFEVEVEGLLEEVVG